MWELYFSVSSLQTCEVDPIGINGGKLKQRIDDQDGQSVYWFDFAALTSIEECTPGQRLLLGRRRSIARV